MNQNQKMMKPKNYWSVAGLFIIMLVISMPFYSAQAMAASVQITKNAGEQNIPRYLDAQGDAWTVQATITGSGVETINPSDVKLKIGNNEASFTSCSPGTLGIVCEYISPLSDGIQEAEYAFQVIYHFLNQVGAPDTVSNGEVIRADGSAPIVLITSLQENRDGKVEIDFAVNDKVRQNAPAIGIKTIEIVDADSGNVLQTISIAETGKEQYNYRSDGGFAGILQAPLAGEGLKRIKVRAVDWLGHESTAPVRVFHADFVAPVIKDNLNFTDFGRFVGEFVHTTDITVDVQESSILTVTGTSSLANINGKEADCEEDLEQIGLWHCTWQNVEVNPVQDSISVDIIAKDELGNTATKTVTRTFTRDIAAPTISFFGTERVFDGKSYVRTGTQRLILKVNDQGAGITANGIKANLLALGKSNSEAPTECTSTDAGLDCYWDTSASLTSGVARVSLSKFEDNVGNLGSSMEAELVVDNSGPKIEKVELYGGDKDYVQSNDQLKLRVKAIESSGMVILVNVNNLVMDAQTKFPETPYSRTLVPTTGWQTFTEDSCEKTEGGYWDCTLLTDPVRSGPENNVEITVHVQDTAGNEAVEWPQEAKNAEIRSSRSNPAKLKFDLLGLSTEENPDYWETAVIRPLGGESAFIDFDAALLTFTRLPFELRLRSANSHAKMVSIDLMGCNAPEQPAGMDRVTPGGEIPASRERESQPAATETTEALPSESPTVSIPTISRSLLYAGVSAEGEAEPKPKIVLEFEPFDGKKMFNLPETGGEHFQTKKVEYTCQFRIFSMVDGDALVNPELQEVAVSVPFGYSTLGAQDAKLEEEIKSEREWVSEGFFGAIGTLQKVLKWADYLIQVYHLINSAVNTYNIASAHVDSLNAVPTGGTAAATAFCFGVTTFNKGADIITSEVLQVPIQILSCRKGIGDIWYDKYTDSVLSFYNFNLLKAAGREVGKNEQVFAKPAEDVKDNMYLSILTLCVPGIIKNLDELRQITCRKIYCLEKEVPAGVATVDSCEKLESLLQCKYFFGELWYALPLVGIYDSFIKALYNLFKDPIAILHTGTILYCGASCLRAPGQNSLNSGCLLAYRTWEVIGFLESAANFITTVVHEFKDGGLQYCDSVL